MREAVAIVSKDEDLIVVQKEMKECRGVLDELEKEINLRAREIVKTKINPLWEKLVSVCKEKGYLPADFEEHKYSVGLEDGVVFIEEKLGADEEMSDLVKRVMFRDDEVEDIECKEA
jgi:hypothetical protein